MKRSKSSFAASPQPTWVAVWRLTRSTSSLARREIRVFLEEWLTRTPDFHIRPGAKPSLVTGVVNSIADLHLEWTPA